MVGSQLRLKLDDANDDGDANQVVSLNRDSMCGKLGTDGVSSTLHMLSLTQSWEIRCEASANNTLASGAEGEKHEAGTTRTMRRMRTAHGSACRAKGRALNEGRTGKPKGTTEARAPLKSRNSRLADDDQVLR